MKKFKTKEQLWYFLSLNTPILIQPKKKGKYMFVSVFSSVKAKNTVIDQLTERLWKELNQKK